MLRCVGGVGAMTQLRFVIFALSPFTQIIHSLTIGDIATLLKIDINSQDAFALRHVEYPLLSVHLRRCMQLQFLLGHICILHTPEYKRKSSHLGAFKKTVMCAYHNGASPSYTPCSRY